VTSLERRPTGFPVAALAAIGALALVGMAGSPRPTDHIPRRHVVEIRGMAFHPQALEVRRGDTIVWINRDIVPHTATSTRNAGWNTGPLGQGKSGEYVARHAGEDPYFCQLHPVMLGKLIVR
jgi:plastocyanin